MLLSCFFWLYSLFIEGGGESQVIASSLALRWRASLEVKRSSLSNAELAARSRESAFRPVEFRSVTAV
jgi:hypothetical protein